MDDTQPLPVDSRQRLTIIAPVVGVLVSVLSVTVLPWQTGDRGTLLLPQVWQLAVTQPQPTAADYYLFAAAYPIALSAILLGFTAFLDSVALRWTTFGLAVVGLCSGGVLMGSASLVSVATTPGIGNQTAVQTGAVLLALCVTTAVVALVRGPVGRLLISGLLGLYAVLHVGMVTAYAFGTPGFTLPFAYTAAVGYLLLGLGALLAPVRS